MLKRARIIKTFLKPELVRKVRDWLEPGKILSSAEIKFKRQIKSQISRDN